jgi:hypothetical protein
MDASLCNIMCEEDVFCGGNGTVNIYDLGKFSQIATSSVSK